MLMDTSTGLLASLGSYMIMCLGHFLKEPMLIRVRNGSWSLLVFNIFKCESFLFYIEAVYIIFMICGCGHKWWAASFDINTRYRTLRVLKIWTCAHGHMWLMCVNSVYWTCMYGRKLYWYLKTAVITLVPMSYLKWETSPKCLKYGTWADTGAEPVAWRNKNAHLEVYKSKHIF